MCVCVVFCLFCVVGVVVSRDAFDMFDCVCLCLSSCCFLMCRVLVLRRCGLFYFLCLFMWCVCVSRYVWFFFFFFVCFALLRLRCFFVVCCFCCLLLLFVSLSVFVSCVCLVLFS